MHLAQTPSERHDHTYRASEVGLWHTAAMIPCRNAWVTPATDRAALAFIDQFPTVGGAHLGSWRPDASLRLPCKVPSELFKFSSLPGSKLVGAQLDLDLS